MNTEEIEKFFVKKSVKDNQQLKIVFKKRNSLQGVFVKGKDYEDLKSKNFWRIVTGSSIAEWKESKNINLAKLFNGSEFSSLSITPESV